MNTVEKLEQKMLNFHMEEREIALFLKQYQSLSRGERGFIYEKDLTSVPYGSIPTLQDLESHRKKGQTLLDKCAIIKLNGGLGTSMGLSGPKSFLPVKGEKRFIDIVVDQVLSLRKETQSEVPLVLMNSAVTNSETKSYIDTVPAIRDQKIPYSFIHNSHPKILVDTLEPASFAEAPAKEWNPAGHGDIYTSLVTSGILDTLIEQGIEYAFISNIDNLGATMDSALLGYLAESDAPFLMEVCHRREMDKKGGHLAKDESGFVLRERAQATQEEIEQFEDITKYSYFNSNSIWLNLVKLQKHIEEKGLLLLPLIANQKNLNPADSNSPKVFQLETAMGSAISLFENTKAVEIPQTRFRPVKKNNDLLLLWSDRFKLNNKGELQEVEGATKSINIELDSTYFAFYTDLKDRVTPESIPSLKECTSLTVSGNIVFGENCVFNGDVRISNSSKEKRVLSNREIQNREEVL